MIEGSMTTEVNRQQLIPSVATRPSERSPSCWANIKLPNPIIDVSEVMMMPLVVAAPSDNRR